MAGALGRLQVVAGSAARAMSEQQDARSSNTVPRRRRVKAGSTVRTEGDAIGVVIGQRWTGMWRVRLPLTDLTFPWHESQLTVIDEPEGSQ